MHDLLDRLAPEVDVDAAWEEVAARMGAPSRGWVVRVLAVAAAVALVAGGAVLATRSSDPERSSEVALGDGYLQYVDEELGITVDYPEDWGRATVGTSVVVGTTDIPGQEGPCAGEPGAAVDTLGPTDALVAIVRRQGFASDEGIPPAVQEFVLPSDPTSGEEYIDCVAGQPDFAYATYSLGGGRAGAFAQVFLGHDVNEATKAQVLEVLERAVVVASVELSYPAIDESPTGSTVVVGAPDQIDAASQRIIDEARAQFELPPNATWPEFGEPVSGSVGVLVVGLAFQSTCAWFDYLVDGIETTNELQELAAGEGLRQLLEDDATAGTGLRSRILQALREAERGQTATARSELEINC